MPTLTVVKPSHGAALHLRRAVESQTDVFVSENAAPQSTQDGAHELFSVDNVVAPCPTAHAHAQTTISSLATLLGTNSAPAAHGSHEMASFSSAPPQLQLAGKRPHNDTCQGGPCYAAAIAPAGITTSHTDALVQTACPAESMCTMDDMDEIISSDEMDDSYALLEKELEEMRAAYDLLNHKVVAMRDEARALKQQLQQLATMTHTTLLDNTAMRAALRESHAMIWQLQNLLEHLYNNGHTVQATEAVEGS